MEARIINCCKPLDLYGQTVVEKYGLSVAEKVGEKHGLAKFKCRDCGHVHLLMK